MARELFVSTESDQIPLFDDGVYWIAVKRQLNAGEAKQLQMGALRRVSPTGQNTDTPSVTYDLDVDLAAFQKVLVYLLDWNLVGPDGKTKAIDTPKEKREAVRALHPAVFAEIERAVDAHVQAQEKKAPNGSPAPAAIS